MKGEFSLEDLIEQCKRVVAKMLPPEPAPPTAAATEERKHWKAIGLYYAILSDSADSFVEMYSGLYTQEEFNDVCKLVKESKKEAGVKTLQTLLQTLKKRKYRSLSQ